MHHVGYTRVKGRGQDSLNPAVTAHNRSYRCDGLSIAEDNTELEGERPAIPDQCGYMPHLVCIGEEKELLIGVEDRLHAVVERGPVWNWMVVCYYPYEEMVTSDLGEGNIFYPFGLWVKSEDWVPVGASESLPSVGFDSDSRLYAGVVEVADGKSGIAKVERKRVWKVIAGRGEKAILVFGYRE